MSRSVYTQCLSVCVCLFVCPFFSYVTRPPDFCILLSVNNLIFLNWLNLVMDMFDNKAKYCSLFDHWELKAFYSSWWSNVREKSSKEPIQEADREGTWNDDIKIWSAWTPMIPSQFIYWNYLSLRWPDRLFRIPTARQCQTPREILLPN